MRECPSTKEMGRDTSKAKNGEMSMNNKEWRNAPYHEEWGNAPFTIKNEEITIYYKEWGNATSPL